MKKVLITIVLLLSVVFSVSAQSVRWGLKGGASFIDMNKDYTSGTGWFVGPMLDVSLPLVGFSVDVSVLYHRYYHEIDFDGMPNQDFTDKYLELPLNVKWTFFNGKSFGLYLGAGPQLTYMDMGAYNNHWAASFNLGGGVNLHRHFQVGINYNLPLGRTFEKWMDGGPPHDVKRKGLWLSLAYLF